MGYGVTQSGTWLKWLSSSSSRWGTVEINEGGGWLLLLLHLPNLVQFPVLASSYLESYRERDLGNCTPQLSQIDTVQILSFIQRDKELPIKFLQWGQPDAITPDLAVSWLSNSLTLQLLLSGQFFSLPVNLNLPLFRLFPRPLFLPLQHDHNLKNVIFAQNILSNPAKSLNRPLLVLEIFVCSSVCFFFWLAMPPSSGSWLWVYLPWLLWHF